MHRQKTAQPLAILPPNRPSGTGRHLFETDFPLKIYMEVNLHFSKHPSRLSIFANICVLAGPIALSQFSHMAHALIDIAMVVQLGDTALASVSLGAVIWVPMLVFIIGLLYSAMPAIGKALAKNDEQKVADILVSSLCVGLFGAVLVSALLLFLSEPLLQRIGLSQQMATGTGDYLNAVAYAFPAIALYFVGRYFLESHQMPLVVTFVALVGVGLKFWLNYVFVSGAGWFQAHGIAGFGYATAAVYCFMSVFIFLLASAFSRTRSVLKKLNFRRLQTAHIMVLFLGGLPIALNFLSDYLVMTVAGISVAPLGESAVASHQIGFNVLSIALIIPLGITFASTILLSQNVDSGETQSALRLRIILVTLTTLVSLTLIFSLLIIWKGDVIAGFYSDTDKMYAAINPFVTLAAIVLPINAVAIGMGFFLRGMGDSASPFMVFSSAYWLLGIPIGWVLCFGSFGNTALGPAGFWWSMIGALIVATIALINLLRTRLKALSAGATHNALTI